MLRDAGFNEVIADDRTEQVCFSFFVLDLSYTHWQYKTLSACSQLSYLFYITFQLKTRILSLGREWWYAPKMSITFLAVHASSPERVGYCGEWKRVIYPRIFWSECIVI